MFQKQKYKNDNNKICSPNPIFFVKWEFVKLAEKLIIFLKIKHVT